MHDIAHVICNFMNPFLAATLLGAVYFQRGQAPWLFLAACVIGVCVAVGLAELGKDFLLYPDHGGFPSGHETFAVATLTCLVWLDRRWLVFAVPAAIVMGVSLVMARFHMPIDVVGAAVLAPLPTSAALSVVRRFKRPAQDAEV